MTERWKAWNYLWRSVISHRAIRLPNNITSSKCGPFTAPPRGQEPAGYLQLLKEKEPEIIFDAAKLRTKEDWIAAGKLVFESDIRFFPAREQPAASEVPWPISKDSVLPGFVPGFRYYVSSKGVLEGGINACAGCHTPPLYTNNRITPAQGFKVPDELRKTEDILDVCVGTDPSLALKTRRGTGFYKVPSLRGVWYRNAFCHAGQAETLEEWLDPARLKDDYVPIGFHLGPGPIQGHEFGLKLPPADKQALIAFLKTL